MVFNGIERFLRESSHANSRTFHMSLTYFWIHIVHLGIQCMTSFISASEPELPATDPTATVLTTDFPSTPLRSTDDAPSLPPISTNPHPSLSDALAGDPPPPTNFAAFIMLNPYVADEHLWQEYYSKGLMMSDQAKVAMVLPDKKVLPNLVVRDVITKGRGWREHQAK
jgi:hypothetical protein